MAYTRFLNDEDYLAIITRENLHQLVRDIPSRIEQAERSAEMDLREYLDDLFEIDKELCKGKAIRDYNPMVSYPPDARFYLDGKPVRALTGIMGYRTPHPVEYWVEHDSLIGFDDKERVPEYRQMNTYKVGNVVSYGISYWRCTRDHGWDFKDIAIPGDNTWGEIHAPEWEAMEDVGINEVRLYNGVYYTLLRKDDTYRSEDTPLESECWGEIGQYSSDYQYSFGLEDHDYTVHLGKVFVPLQNPNADELKENVNFVYDDARNDNIVKHMTRIALYYLHQTVSPTNIPQSRRDMYEESKLWLEKASRLKLNPQIPRKKGKGGEPKDDWAFEDFTTDYAEMAKNNPWIL